jgi:ParB/RepB/Spo0J family partition protein
MSRLRDRMQVKEIKICDILEEDAPLEHSLMESLLEVEQKDIIKVTPKDNKYLLIDGRRRVRALKEAGAQTVLALVIAGIDDTELHLQALIGNSGTPNPADEFDHIMYLVSKGLKQNEIAKKVNYSPAKVTQTLRIGKLIPEIRQALKKGDITYSAALQLTYLPESQQKDIFESGEKLTFKKTDAVKRQFQSEQFAIDFGNNGNGTKVKSGLYLTSEDMEKLVNGDCVEKNYDGQTLLLKVC